METGKLAVWQYVMAAVIGAIVGGAIVFALTPSKAELEGLRTERDTLSTEVRGLKERVTSLQGEVQSLTQAGAGLKSEIERLSATVAEKEAAEVKAGDKLAVQQRALAELKERSQSLAGENEALKKTLAGVREKVEASAAEREALSSKLGAAERALKETQARAAELDKRHGALLAEKTTLAERAAQQQAKLEEGSRALATENEALRKKLAGLGEKVEASAAEREALSRKLGVAGRTLEEAQKRAAELDKRYESLLAEKTTLVERAAKRRTELAETKKALDEAQNEVARLMGARGIYTVQKGDSLSTIAAFFYRDGFRWPDIFKANSYLIRQPDLIYPLQLLIIPH